MIKKLKNLLTRSTQVREEQTDLANSAIRIGQLLIDILKAFVSRFDDSATYDAGQYVIDEGVLVEVLEDTSNGDTPSTAPAKFDRKIITDPALITAGNKLPVAGSAVRTLVDQIVLNGGIPNASKTQRGAARQATDQENALGQNDDTYISPKQSKATYDKFYADYANIAIDKFGEQATDEALIAFLTKLFTAAQNNQAIADLLCPIVQLGNCGGTPTPQPLALTLLDNYYEVADEVGPFLGRASVENNNCEMFGGWVYMQGIYPAYIRIEVDGLFEAYETAKVGRDDVRIYLNNQGINTTNTIFQWNHLKKAKYRDGQAHTWRAFVGDTDIEAFEYHVPQVKTCEEPQQPNDPYVLYLKQEPLNSITKGLGGTTIGLLQVMNDGTEQAYSGTVVPVWSVGGSPTGIVLTPDNIAMSVDVEATNAATVDSFNLQCTLTLPQRVQVITIGCTRPANLPTYQLSWHFIPTGGNAQLYGSLDEANTVAGQKFDGTKPGDLDPFFMQAANLNVGTEVFLRNDINTCEKVGDNIYYVLSAVGGNTIKRAIQVVNGIIVAVKDSTYTTPLEPKILQVRRKFEPEPDGVIYYVKTQLTGILGTRYILQERHNPNNFDLPNAGWGDWSNLSIGQYDENNFEYSNGAPPIGNSVRFEFRIYDTQTNQVYAQQSVLGFDFTVPASATPIETLYTAP